MFRSDLYDEEPAARECGVLAEKWQEGVKLN
jgi:hypothetical protein